MKKRNPYLVSLFSLTGIYTLYWYVKTKEEMNKKGAKIPSLWIVFAPLLALILVAILQIVSHFVLNNSSSSLHTPINILSIILGVGAVIAILPMFIFFLWRYCGGIGIVTGGKRTQSNSFWLFIGLAIFADIVSRVGSALSGQAPKVLLWIVGAIIGVIWYGMMQKSFNESSLKHAHQQSLSDK